jgi:ribosome-binding factor A
MAREFKRADRVADAVQRCLAQVIPLEIRDPRLGMVNINAVVVAKDLTTAKIYVTLVGEADEQRCRQSVEILNKASSYLRTLLSKDVSLRISPRLYFYYDESSVRGQALSHLIDRAVASDRAHHAKHEDDREE